MTLGSVVPAPGVSTTVVAPSAPSSLSAPTYCGASVAGGVGAGITAIFLPLSAVGESPAV